MGSRLQRLWGCAVMIRVAGAPLRPTAFEVPFLEPSSKGSKRFLASDLKRALPTMRTRTHRSAFHCLVLIVLLGTPALAQWERVAPGIDYRHYQEGKMDIHVARIDLQRDDLRIVSTRESDAGTRVSEFAKRNKALVAINGDYFDENMVPIGLAVGPCGQWESTRDTAREGVVAFGERRGEIYEPAERMEEPEPWIEAAVSGWPMIVKDCDALTSRELPGSDKFTRSPHPRTAVGLSRDGSRLFLVVAD